jgi:hypothetical protein
MRPPTQECVRSRVSRGPGRSSCAPACRRGRQPTARLRARLQRQPLRGAHAAECVGCVGCVRRCVALCCQGRRVNRPCRAPRAAAATRVAAAVCAACAHTAGPDTPRAKRTRIIARVITSVACVQHTHSTTHSITHSITRVVCDTHAVHGRAVSGQPVEQEGPARPCSCGGAPGARWCAGVWQHQGCARVLCVCGSACVTAHVPVLRSACAAAAAAAAAAKTHTQKPFAADV